MALNHVALVENAVIETEREIAGDAWDQEETELDETGDRSLEELGEGLEGQHEPEDDEEEDDESESDDGEGEGEAAETEGDGKEKTDAEKPDGKDVAQRPQGERGEAKVPGRVVREASERARKAEAERDDLRKQLEAKNNESAETQRKLDALSQRFEGFVSAQRQAPPDAAKTEPVKRPDIFENPDGVFDYVEKGIKDQLAPLSGQLNDLRVNTSMQIAEAVHGEKFANAMQSLRALDPNNVEHQAVVRRIVSSPNPGRSLIDWHGQQETLRRVGNDPAKYEADLRAQVRAELAKDPEFVKQVVQSLRAEASTANNGQPRTQLRLPRSLNGAGGSNLGVDRDTSAFDDSDQAVADAAWR